MAFCILNACDRDRTNFANLANHDMSYRWPLVICRRYSFKCSPINSLSFFLNGSCTPTHNGLLHIEWSDIERTKFANLEGMENSKWLQKQRNFLHQQGFRQIVSNCTYHKTSREKSYDSTSQDNHTHSRDSLEMMAKKVLVAGCRTKSEQVSGIQLVQKFSWVLSI